MHESASDLAALFIVVPSGLTIACGATLSAVPIIWARTMQRVDAGRNHSLDGLRGLLTLWVLTHHLDVGPEMVQPLGSWQVPSGVLGALMNSGFFVAPFFMLTAMLFVSGLIASEGKILTRTFVRKRLFKLVPTYLVSIFVLVLTAFYMTGFRLQVLPFKLCKEIARWLLLDFVPRYDINGIDVSRAHGMLWTLRFEIGFYAVLPILAWMQRRLGNPIPVFVGLALLALIWWPFVFFTAGAFVALGLGWRSPRAVWFWQAASVTGIGLIIITAEHSSAVLQAVLVAPVLIAITLEAPLFRLLANRAIRFVGEISYSVYILHYPLIWILFSLVIAPESVQRMPFLERSAILIVCGFFILIVSTLSFHFIERPFIGYGGRSGALIEKFRLMLRSSTVR